MPSLWSPVKGLMNIVGVRRKGDSKSSRSVDDNSVHSDGSIASSPDLYQHSSKRGSMIDDMDNDQFSKDRNQLLQQVAAIAEVDQSEVRKVMNRTPPIPISTSSTKSQLNSKPKPNTNHSKEDNADKEYNALASMEIDSLKKIVAFVQPEVDLERISSKHKLITLIQAETRDTKGVRKEPVSLSDGKSAARYTFLDEVDTRTIRSTKLGARGIELEAAPYDGPILNHAPSTASNTRASSPQNDDNDSKSIDSDNHDNSENSPEHKMFYNKPISMTNIPTELDDFQEYARLARLSRTDLAKELRKAGIENAVFRNEHECRVALVGHRLKSNPSPSPSPRTNFVKTPPSVNVSDNYDYKSISPSVKAGMGKQKVSTSPRARVESPTTRPQSRSVSPNQRAATVGGSIRQRSVSPSPKKGNLSKTQNFYYKSKLMSNLPESSRQRKEYGIYSKLADKALDRELRRLRIDDYWYRNNHEKVMAILDEHAQEENAGVSVVLGSTGVATFHEVEKRRSFSPHTLPRESMSLHTTDRYRRRGSHLTNPKPRKNINNKQMESKKLQGFNGGVAKYKWRAGASINYYYAAKLGEIPSTAWEISEYRTINKLSNVAINQLIEEHNLSQYTFRDHHETVMALVGERWKNYERSHQAKERAEKLASYSGRSGLISVRTRGKGGLGTTRKDFSPNMTKRISGFGSPNYPTAQYANPADTQYSYPARWRNEQDMIAGLIKRRREQTLSRDPSPEKNKTNVSLMDLVSGNLDTQVSSISKVPFQKNGNIKNSNGTSKIPRYGGGVVAKDIPTTVAENGRLSSLDALRNKMAKYSTRS
jgi:hypothetical protein